MSMPQKHITEIREGCYAALKQEMKTKSAVAKDKKRELDEIKGRLNSVEEKWFNNEINKDTYDRWYSNYSEHIVKLTLVIERLSINHGKAFEILDHNLHMLSDICTIYEHADTLQKT